MPSVPPRRASVRPRVLSASTGESLLLEDAVEPFLGKAGLVCISGEPGEGKTTALAHLAAALPRGTMCVLLDDPTPADLEELPDHLLGIYTARAPLDRPHLATFPIEPWDRDECLEYLLALHKGRCGSVMARLAALTDPPELPELWTIGLEWLARDETLTSFGAAFRRELDARFSGRTRRFARRRALALSTGLPPGWLEPHGCFAWLGPRALRPEEERFLRHDRIHTLLAAEQVIDDLERGYPMDYLTRQLPGELVREAGRLATDRACLRLRRLLVADPSVQPMAASLLWAAGRPFRPDHHGVFKLVRAWLSGVPWPSLRLPSADLSYADLCGADLRESTLDEALLHRTLLRQAILQGASLRGCSAEGADFTEADLSRVRAVSGFFKTAKFRDARLEGAFLEWANFYGADLRGARMDGATLRHATLRAADIEGASFARADLEGVKLAGRDLRVADFSGARFDEADLEAANLESISLPGVSFVRACLRKALLTGSSLPRAQFQGADLQSAGLGDVDWPDVDLRGVNLRGATFHMGSSRSGLVFGEPLEGSRTGFYTDDFHDLEFKSPEEIRKANLCGADLRGATIEGVDFYLVDLRGATYDDEQEAHFRRCGAILGVRA